MRRLGIVEDVVTCATCKNWERSCEIHARQVVDARRHAHELEQRLLLLQRTDGIVGRGDARREIEAAWRERDEARVSLAISEKERRAQGARIMNQRNQLAKLEAAHVALLEQRKT
jgi:hypothetical protein